MTLKEQKLRHIDPEDGIEKETHIYSGPQGQGFIEFEFRVVSGVKQMRSKHTGPEKREDTNWEWVTMEKSDV